MGLSRPKKATNQGIPAASIRRDGSCASGMLSASRSASERRQARASVGGSERSDGGPARVQARARAHRDGPARIHRCPCAPMRPAARSRLGSSSAVHTARPPSSTIVSGRAVELDPGGEGGRGGNRRRPAQRRRSTASTEPLGRGPKPETRCVAGRRCPRSRTPSRGRPPPGRGRPPRAGTRSPRRGRRGDAPPALHLQGRVRAEPLEAEVAVEAGGRGRREGGDEGGGGKAGDRQGQAGEVAGVAHDEPVGAGRHLPDPSDMTNARPSMSVMPARRRPRRAPGLAERLRRRPDGGHARASSRSGGREGQPPSRARTRPP